VPLLKALAGPDDILGTQHRNSPIEIIALGYCNIQARDVPFENNKAGTRSIEATMKLAPRGKHQARPAKRHNLSACYPQQ
jgi:hypothetical protein